MNNSSEKLNALVNDLLTVLILTSNEEVNIGRVMDRLKWAGRVIVIDSFSTDRTLEIINQYPNTDVFPRKFDTHARQWNYGLSLVKTKWVLTLDADYILTEDFIKEIMELVIHGNVPAYFARFRFLVFGKKLRGNNTTPRPVLFLKDWFTYYDDGHTQRLKIDWVPVYLKSPILHDDRKPLGRWLMNQDKYSAKEADKLIALTHQNKYSFLEQIRLTKIVAPFFVFFYCLFIKGLIFNGWAGWHYTLQRTTVEILFALRLIEKQKLENNSITELKINSTPVPFPVPDAEKNLQSFKFQK